MSFLRFHFARLLAAGTFFMCISAAIVPAFAESPKSNAPATGPQTEARFPALVLPSGFRATLFACDPLVEYPSVIALGPRAGTLFVAHDYMTGLGTEIVRRDEVRLLEDSNGDGYADKSIVFAGGFNSIQGLAYFDGTVYVMHAPFFTSLKDTNGDGVADERRDLFSGLGLKPEDNPPRLHCANGVVVGHDGWLYLAVGDHGVDVARPDGGRLVLHGGGILRCRPDGRDLHVFATGLRNIYDVALDEELNVFVRDNENDGGDYMIRVCQSFHGADHGYPYRYYERPDEALRPLADLGRGSSAGGVCYNEAAFPPEYRGNLFFCEWGRAVVRYERKRDGSSFAPMKEFDFAAGAPNDPYGFKPTDVIVDRDGSLLISDWGDDQRPKRGRGRIYRVCYQGKDEAAKGANGPVGGSVEDFIDRLNDERETFRTLAQTQIERAGDKGLQAIAGALQANWLGVRGRMHAVWIMAHLDAVHCIGELEKIAGNDADSRVRVQAVRAITDLCDPSIGPGSKRSNADIAKVARQLADSAGGQSPPVLLEIVTALGRLRWKEMPAWLNRQPAIADPTIAHAAMQALRRCGNWPAVLSLLDEPSDQPIHSIALRACAERTETLVVDGLLDRLAKESSLTRRMEYADALTRVYKRPGEWTYWGYRPAPRPANSVAWERTEAIAQAVNKVLADRDRDVRLSVLRRMQREHVPVQVTALGGWLADERAPQRVQAILESLAVARTSESKSLVEKIVRGRDFNVENRRAAISTWIAGLTAGDEPRLAVLGGDLEDGPLVAEILGVLGKRASVDARPLALKKLDSNDPEVRAAALLAVASGRYREASPGVLRLLEDRDLRVRRAAAAAAGQLAVNESTSVLLKMAGDSDAEIRRASLESLRLLREPKAVAAAVAALDNIVTQSAALDYLAEFGGMEQSAALVALAAGNRSVDVLTGVVKALANWEARETADSETRRQLAQSIAAVQGKTGALLRWRVVGPVAPEVATELLGKPAALQSLADLGVSKLAAGPNSQVELAVTGSHSADAAWLAISDISLAEPTRAQFLASADAPFQVEINGRNAFRRDAATKFEPDADRFEAPLAKGANRIVVRLSAATPVKFQVRFRPLSSSAEHERLAQYALKNNGNADRGRRLFLNVEKSLCVKCHRIGEKGGNIGPDLTGVGSRFSKVHIIESILEPSRAIAQGYDSVSVALTNGQVVVGVKVAEDAGTLTLGDDKGERHVLRKSDIEERAPLKRSTMPDGLEKRFTDAEFLDLLSYLLSEKKRPLP